MLTYATRNIKFGVDVNTEVNLATKVNMFPIKKNNILLRLENIGDLFDGDEMTWSLNL